MNQANYLYGKKVSTVRTYGPRINLRDQTTIMQYTNRNVQGDLFTMFM